MVKNFHQQEQAFYMIIDQAQRNEAHRNIN